MIQAASMPKRKRPGRPRKHGGRREGAGRPRLEGVGTTRTFFELLDRHIAKVERWEEEHGCSSPSEALRQMIDSIPEK